MRGAAGGSFAALPLKRVRGRHRQWRRRATRAVMYEELRELSPSYNGELIFGITFDAPAVSAHREAIAAGAGVSVVVPRPPGSTKLRRYSLIGLPVFSHASWPTCVWRYAKCRSRCIGRLALPRLLLKRARPRSAATFFGARTTAEKR